MTKKRKNAKQEALELPETLNISNAVACFHMMQDHTATSEGGFTIDGSKVQTITTPGIQVVLLSVESMEEKPRIIASANMMAAFSDLGLSEWLSKRQA